MPKLDLADPVLPRHTGNDYPERFAARAAGRRIVSLGAGLSDYGVSLVTVPPGGWSSLRHWHPDDDEFLWMVAGSLVLVEDGTRTPMGVGDCATFPKASGNGHHLVNESDADATFVVVGANKGGTEYPDIDLRHVARETGYRHRDGARY